MAATHSNKIQPLCNFSNMKRRSLDITLLTTVLGLNELLLGLHPTLGMLSGLL